MANAPNGGDHASIDICDLNRRLATSIDSLPPSPFGEHCCIFRVDKKFRKKNEYAYTPEVFPIGPFHHEKAVTPHKLRYMQALLSRTANPETKLQECIEAISSKEDEARKCYSEPVEPDRDNFIQMMLVDGLFIIEVFRRGAGEVRIDRGDPIFNNIWILSSTVHDMILLENQLPMFVLQELFRITTAGEGGKSLNELAIRFFNSLMNKEEEALANYFQNPNYLNLEEKHLLDLLRKTFFDLHLPQGSSIALAPGSKYVPAVTELRQAGVFFRKGSNAGSFLDIKFTERVLEIPHIVINDGTESLLRNVIALEQNGDVHHTYTMSYALFMNKLIGSSNDVALLCKSGIITNYLGDDECVSALFNKLCSGVPISHFHYAHLCNQLNTYYTTIQLILNVQDQLAPSVTELEEAGVKFRKASVESGNFLDISFANGVLNIPPIQIKDQTESLLLNFIAWEHCCDDESDTCITSYVILMDNLINTANDVEVLRKSGIIGTYKTNDECVSLFKKLTNEVFVCNFYYSDLCKALTIYNDQWHVGTTELPTRRAIEGCFECGDPSHWKEACPWIRFPCAKGPYSGCPGTMKIYTSWQDHSKGRRFMTCQHPGCNGFIWVDMVAPYWFDDDECSNRKGKGKNEDNGRSVKEDNKEEERGNIKLQLHGKIPMTLEGNVDDICRCVKNLEL